MLFILITLSFVIVIVGAMIAINTLMVSRRPEETPVVKAAEDPPAED